MLTSLPRSTANNQSATWALDQDHPFVFEHIPGALLLDIKELGGADTSMLLQLLGIGESD
jgi:hypothetical protein